MQKPIKFYFSSLYPIISIVFITPANKTLKIIMVILMITAIKKQTPVFCFLSFPFHTKLLSFAPS